MGPEEFNTGFFGPDVIPEGFGPVVWGAFPLGFGLDLLLTGCLGIFQSSGEEFTEHWVIGCDESPSPQPELELVSIKMRKGQKAILTASSGLWLPSVQKVFNGGGRDLLLAAHR